MVDSQDGVVTLEFVLVVEGCVCDEVGVLGVADVALLARVVRGMHQQGRGRVCLDVARREVRLPRLTVNTIV